MTTRKYIATGIVAAVVAGAFIAYRTYNKPHRDIAGERAVYAVSADALFDAFEQNEADANARYLDQVVEVTGNISSVESNSAGETVLTLAAQNALIGGISATMDGGSPVGDAAEGSIVTLKCRCTGFLMDVVMVNCSVKSEGS